ncbi:DsrE family protein [Desulfoplanes sp.]
MQKTVLFAFNGDPMCFIHVLLNGLDMAEKGHEVGIVMEGAAVKLVPELAKDDHPLHQLYAKACDKELFFGACQACSAKLGVLAEVKSTGMTMLADMKGHPSISGYMDQGFTVITF